MHLACYLHYDNRLSGHQDGLLCKVSNTCALAQDDRSGVIRGTPCYCADVCLHYRQEVQRLQAAEKDASALRTREAKLQTALAEKNLENLELRWRLAAAREATNPSLAQVIFYAYFLAA